MMAMDTKDGMGEMEWDRAMNRGCVVMAVLVMGLMGMGMGMWMGMGTGMVVMVMVVMVMAMEMEMVIIPDSMISAGE